MEFDVFDTITGERIMGLKAKNKKEAEHQLHNAGIYNKSKMFLIVESELN